MPLSFKSGPNFTSSFFYLPFLFHSSVPSYATSNWIWVEICFCPHFNHIVFDIQNSSSNHKEMLHMTRQQWCRGICKSFYRFEGQLSDLNHEQNLPHGGTNWGRLLIQLTCDISREVLQHVKTCTCTCDVTTGAHRRLHITLHVYFDFASRIPCDREEVYRPQQVASIFAFTRIFSHI